MVASRDPGQPSGAPSSEEYGQGLRRGDPEAVRHVRERVRRILSHRRFGISHHEREDLEQEVMAELWRSVNRPGFDFTAGFWGFVEMVVSRRCIDWIRSKRGVVTVVADIQDQGKDPLDEVLDAERSELAERIVQALEPTCRGLIKMRFHNGMSYSEIARVLGKSEAALRVQLHRCIRSAQGLLAEYLPAASHDPKRRQP